MSYDGTGGMAESDPHVYAERKQQSNPIYRDQENPAPTSSLEKMQEPLSYQVVYKGHREQDDQNASNCGSGREFGWNPAVQNQSHQRECQEKGAVCQLKGCYENRDTRY